MKIPKGISQHKAVLEVEDAKENGYDNRRYDVFLKENWMFRRGTTAGTRSLLCNTVQEFLDAEPTPVVFIPAY